MVLRQLRLCAVASGLVTRKSQTVFKKKSPTKGNISYQAVTLDESEVGVLFREEKCFSYYREVGCFLDSVGL